MTKRLLSCIRCGLCCIAAPCDDTGTSCKYLSVSDTLTTTCLNKSAVEAYIGNGCFIRSLPALYDDTCEMHNFIKTKQSIRKDQLKHDTLLKEERRKL